MYKLESLENTYPAAKRRDTILFPSFCSAFITHGPRVLTWDMVDNLWMLVK